MNIEAIKNGSTFVNSTTTKWALLEYDCRVSFYTWTELPDLHFVICSMLAINEGRYKKKALGEILGFSVWNGEDSLGRKMYYDKNEEDAFEQILKLVENDRLVVLGEDYVILTALGRISLTENKLYHFFRGQQRVCEHMKLTSLTPSNILMFPYYEDMGISTAITSSSQYWPVDEDIEDIIYYEPSELARRLNLASTSHMDYYETEQLPYPDVKHVTIGIELYERGRRDIVVIKNGDGYASRATEILGEPVNDLMRENLALECRFQKLWADNDTVWDYRTFLPYEELFDYEQLTKDDRVVWSDDKLFAAIANHANPVCWSNISRHCDVDVIERHLLDIDIAVEGATITEVFDWKILSERLSSIFLVEHFLEFPWDLEVLSGDVGRDIDIIQSLILLQKETTDEWDWDALETRLKDDFVMEYLDLVEVNLKRFTKDTLQCWKAIVAYPDKRWDWASIETGFSLEFFYEYASDIPMKIGSIDLLDRIFTDADWADKFAKNFDFIAALRINIENEGVLSTLTLNDKEYLWSSEVIDALVDLGLVSWESMPYMAGLECNPYIKWDKSLICKYATHISSPAGFKTISLSVASPDLVNQLPSFNWDWDVLSQNVSLIKNEQFLDQYCEQLNWAIVINSIDDVEYLQNIQDIQLYLADDDKQAWTAFSLKADLSYIRQSPRAPWDWNALTERVFASDTFKPDKLGGRNASRWNWDYLSSNLSFELVVEYLESYKNYWNWEIITERIAANYSVGSSLLEKFAQCLQYVEADKSDTAWRVLSSRLPYAELKRAIKNTYRNPLFHWNYTEFSLNKEFDIATDLDECREFVDWHALSSSVYVDRKLRYDKRRGIKQMAWNNTVKALLKDEKNHWDYRALSSFDSLKSERWFLSSFKDQLDWEVISSESKLFVNENKDELYAFINEFKDYIAFELLSSRSDIKNMAFISKNFPQASYDFNSMIENGYKVTFADVLNHPEYKWDWALVSATDSFKPTQDFLLDNIDKPFDWGELSHKDIASRWSEEFLIKLASRESISKQIDWKEICHNDTFPITITLLMSVRDDLDWYYLSRKEKMIDILDSFVEYVDWDQICKNKAFHVNDITVLEKYRNYLNWEIISSRHEFKYSVEILNLFEDDIEWTAASESTDIEFTEALIQKYKNRWNWPVLFNNRRFRTLDLRDNDYKHQQNIKAFINEFPVSSPKVYHYAHMSNAVQIILTQKLMSRNTANGKFVDCAGSNVDRTAKAHGFARFYFKPKSPTQFYNEFLGMDSTNTRFYQTAYNLGLPKCPEPVFFEFDLKEVLMKMPEKCYYSTGNMQKDDTRFFKVMDNPLRIRAAELYVQRPEKDIRQQEFLVEGELDFTNLTSFRIVCCDDIQRDILLSEIGDSRFESKVVVDRTLFEFKNKRLEIKNDHSVLSISTNYNDPYIFRVEYMNQAPEILNIDNIQGRRGNSLFLKDGVKVKKDTPFNVYFEVNTPKVRSWLVYSNK